MRALRTFTVSLLCLPWLAAAAGCSTRVDLPEAVQGIWRVEEIGNEGDGHPDAAFTGIHLRIEQVGERGEVYLATGREAGAGRWFGPLPLRRSGTHGWSFRIPPEIVTVDGDTTTRHLRPQASRLGKLLVDQRGRHLVGKSVHLVEDERAIALQFDGGRLTAVGLWVEVENLEWNDAGEPTRHEIRLLQSVLVRADPGRSGT